MGSRFSLSILLQNDYSKLHCKRAHEILVLIIKSCFKHACAATYSEARCMNFALKLHLLSSILCLCEEQRPRETIHMLRLV